MRKFSDAILPVVLLILLLLVVFCLGFAIIGGLAVGLGHVLMRILPLSLFEATLLSTVFAITTIYLIIKVGGLLAPPDFSSQIMEDQAEDEDGEAEYMRIPVSRFYKTETERTWEAWFRSEIANGIYMEFQDAQQAVANLNETQKQELAIRLSDVALSILKRKKRARGRLRINMPGLKRELSRMGQQAYDDGIMQLALDAINMNLDYYAPVLQIVIRTEGWNDLAKAPNEPTKYGY